MRSFPAQRLPAKGTAACLLALLLAIALSAPAVGHAAEAEPEDVDDLTRAMIQKEKLKQARLWRNAMGGNVVNGTSGCGQIDIGNSTARSGIRKPGSTQTTIIVTGPVINATQCR
jgi:hypothetical protein